MDESMKPRTKAPSRGAAKKKPVHPRVAKKDPPAKDSSEQFRELTERINWLFDRSPVSKSFTLPDGKVNFNQAFCDMLGYTQAELRGKTWQELSHPDDVGSTQQIVDMLVSGKGDSARFEKRYLHKNGTVIWADVITRLLRDARGRPISFMTTVINISSRKIAEDELRQREDRFRQIAESLPQLIWTCRADGPCDYLSRQWVAYTGIPEVEQLGYGWLNQLHPDDRERVAREWQEVTPEGVVFDIEFRIRRHDGVYRWFKTRAIPMKDSSGRVVKWFGSNTDIQDVKEHEEALRETNVRLERSNRELEQFAYVASHDLQEPLRMISSYTQLLEKRYRDRLDQDAHDFIAFAVDGANRMQRLIQDLLQFSRVTTRGQPLLPLDSHSALGEAIKNLHVSIQESGALVSNGDLPVVRGDRTQIVQLFQNLIDNSIKFHKHGIPPLIQVTAGEDTQRAGYWVFRVSDNGIGIESRHQERIFEIFQRLHTQKEHQGTGIGLALCKRIVVRNGGRIWVESDPGKGATFCFTLPGDSFTAKGERDEKK
jgi:PAS domain S-box-containing protein